MERLFKREWGLGEKDRAAIKGALLKTIRARTSSPAQVIGATMAIVETQKLDQTSVDQLIKCGLLQQVALGQQAAGHPQLVDDRDLAAGLLTLLGDGGEEGVA